MAAMSGMDTADRVEGSASAYQGNAAKDAGEGMPFRFLDLPREIRQRIYEYALPPLIMEIRNSLEYEEALKPGDQEQGQGQEPEFAKATRKQALRLLFERGRGCYSLKPLTVARRLERNEPYSFDNAPIRYAIKPTADWLSLLLVCKTTHEELVERLNKAPIEVYIPECNAMSWSPQSLLGIAEKERVVSIDLLDGYSIPAAHPHVNRCVKWMGVLLPLFPNLRYLAFKEQLTDNLSLYGSEIEDHFNDTWPVSLRMMRRTIQSSRLLKHVMFSSDRYWSDSANIYEFVAHPSQARGVRRPEGSDEENSDRPQYHHDFHKKEPWEVDLDEDVREPSEDDCGGCGHCYGSDSNSDSTFHDAEDGDTHDQTELLQQIGELTLQVNAEGQASTETVGLTARNLARQNHILGTDSTWSFNALSRPE